MSATWEGQFRFALKGYSSNGIYMMGSDGDGTFKRSQEEFSLTEGTENLIVSRLKADLPVHLIKANGQAIDIISTSTNPLNPTLPWSSLGTVRSLDSANPYGDAEIVYNMKSTETPFTLRSLAMPGTYTMQVLGRVFKPFTVSGEDTEVKAYEDGRPFKLSGRIQDPQGQPIPGAFVLINNGNLANQTLLAVSADLSKNMG